MAHLLATQRTAAVEYQLHAFELAYVLSLMEVDSVAALPNAVLFPKDSKLRKKVLLEGQKQLIAGGKMIPDKSSGQASYDDRLLSLAAAIADPRFTILTRRETSEGERSNAAIFFTNVEIVEVTQTDRQAFRLRGLAEVDDAFRRVRKMLGFVAREDQPEISVELPISTFERVREYATKDEPEEAIVELTAAGLSVDEAENFVMALKKPKRKGVVSILKHAAQKVVDVRVLGFYRSSTAMWLSSVASEPPDRVRLEMLDADGFIRRLAERVASVCT